MASVEGKGLEKEAEAEEGDKELQEPAIRRTVQPRHFTASSISLRIIIYFKVCMVVSR